MSSQQTEVEVQATCSVERRPEIQVAFDEAARPSDAFDLKKKKEDMRQNVPVGARSLVGVAPPAETGHTCLARSSFKTCEKATVAIRRPAVKKNKKNKYLPEVYEVR